MINIYVGGRLAVLPENFSFEYVSESVQFADSDGYSLEITFPLKGCVENVAIFGHVNRDDVAKSSELLSCMIVSGAFVRSGALAVVEVTESYVKGQFLNGVDPLHEERDADSLYINELDLGRPAVTDPKHISPREAFRGTGSEVCLPWRPEGYDVVNNYADSPDVWNSETRRLTWQPYLLQIMRRIALQAGYTPDFSALPEIWNRAIVCNTLPPSWELPGYADAMPRWTVTEFFQKLGAFLRGAFSFDEQAKTISFASFAGLREKAGEVVLSDVVDEYTSSVSRDSDDSDYLPMARYRYRHSDNVIWKYQDCPWIHDTGWSVDTSRDTLEKLTATGRQYGTAGRAAGEILYCAEIDTYFTYRSVIEYSKGHVKPELSEKYPYAKYVVLQPLNVFAPDDYDPDEDYEELDFVPADVDFTFEGKMLWLPVGTYGEADGEKYDPLDSDLFSSHEEQKGLRLSNGVWISENIVQSRHRSEVEIENHSDEDEGTGFFDCIYIAFQNPKVDVCPWPLVDVDVDSGGVRSVEKFMRLEGGGAGEPVIDRKVKYSFTFLYPSIPDVDAMFVIHGQRYICRRITAQFDINGMSRKLKGEFYRII